VTRSASGVRVEVVTAGRLSRADRDGVHATAARYAQTIGIPVVVGFR
jgi:hypothetical protein